MRPHRLTLEGFTCFREPAEIDFTGMDVFVIAGPTGAGKTTIIDAICYALYGKVPRGTTVKDLIARDASEMNVQLEFESGGRSYRVHRGMNVARTTAKKTGAEKVSRDISPVQFERRIADGEWEPLHDRVTDVNDAIEEVVGLDFDSFTKCVLLPQGRFAEFLTGQPAERRKILVDLLDIGIYTRIMSAANTRAATLTTQIADRERQLVDDYANATVEALAATRDLLVSTRPLLETERERRGALQQAAEYAAAVMTARRHEAEHKQQLDAKTLELKSVEQAAKDGAQTLADLAATLEAAESELAKARYDPNLHAALGRAELCAKQVERARSVAEDARSAASDRSAADRAATAAADTEAALAKAREALAAADEALRDAERADVAAHLRSGLKPGDPCPVCGGVTRTLPKAGKSTMAAAQRTLKDARATEATAAAAATKASAAAAVAQKSFEAAAEQAESAEAEVARAEAELAATLPDGVAAELHMISAKLAEQERAHVTFAALTSHVEQGRRALEEHRKAIVGSERAIVALKAEIAQIDASVTNDRLEGDASLAELKQIAAQWQWADVLELIDAKKPPLELLKQMLAASQRETEELTGRVAKLEATEQHIARAIERASALRSELGGMKERHQLCRDLGVLLRADNFQQFVIVEAMQVLADAATEHLRTLFDRFGIRVDGGEFTVVDHWQADQVRPAKTLSGGETFVASLALALALAEQLPQLRSAAASSLESLFLDEGFGTLDAETLDTVIEALEGLRSEERMVGVITHVPELTQRIEHQIIVKKSPSGSTVAVAGAVA